jgi:multicomponent K+:H+ antiporter subunit A
LRGSAALTPLDLVSLAAVLCLAAATVAAVIWHRRRWLALVLVSVVGLVVSLAFVKLSAPDLALTQLLVEVVTTILLLLALYFLPAHTPSESSWMRRIGDLGIASLLGALTAALTWGVLTRPQETIAGWFVDNSKPGGGGTNVVNVILVDFRGFDTLGEITVLAIAAIGIYMLLDGIRLTVPATDGFGQRKDWDHHPIVLATFSRLLLPLALLVGVFILLRGHNLPGGGFIAGLVVGVAIILQYLANGIAWTRVRITGQMHPLIGLGLLLATATGLASLYFGYPFLTSAHEHYHPPLVGDVELASAMVFDIGVLMVVVGITLVILIRLGEVSLGKRREDARPGPGLWPRREEEA